MTISLHASPGQDRSQSIHHAAVIVDLAGVNAVPADLKEGGVTAYSVSVGVHDAQVPDNVLQAIARYLNSTHAHPDELTIITSVDDILRAKTEHKIGYILHFQGIPSVPGIYWIEMFARIGVKIMALTYNQRNAYGDGAGEREDRGTTYLGRQVIRELNRLGVLVDLSHLGHRTGLEVVETSTKPVVLSHSNCYSLVAHPRNAKDELIRAVAQSGGNIGISVYAPLSDRQDGRFPTIDDVLDHVDHAVELVGIDHVALGSDCAGSMDDTAFWVYQQRHGEVMPPYTLQPPYLGKRQYQSVEGFPTMAALPSLTEGLLQRGYSEQDVHKFLGGNSLRVLSEVW